jgi:hypothetical protein
MNPPVAGDLIARKPLTLFTQASTVMTETVERGLFRAAETVLAAIYENVDACASTVRTRKATGKPATATG